ncbi:MAG: glycosyltransferase [Alphaproteobacteria bacterium]|nr:glycosyltransferase [Alphaproteobacteria bacterium]
MAKRRVLCFSIGTFAPTAYALGGNIYGKNLVQRLSEDDGIELFVVNANAEANRQGTEEFFKQMGIELLYVPVNPIGPATFQPERRTFVGAMDLIAKKAFRFPYELEAHNQLHIAKAASWAIGHWRADCVLFDYLPAVLFWRGVEQIPVPKFVVTVNREADLYADMLAVDNSPRSRWIGRISRWRLARLERRIHRTFDKTIAIGAPDVPSYLPAGRTAVVTSYLDESPELWRYQGNKTLFFVGNVGHYPNRLAIKYIVSKLAPKVLARVPDAKFVIIGASPDQVPVEYHNPSIDLMGPSTPAEVERLFKTASLFLCPVENTFGMKFKVAEAASYGTPFLASEQTMLGFPYFGDFPCLHLDDPDRSADTIAGLLRSATGLKALSDNVLTRQRNFAASQKNIWSRTLFG